MSRKTVIRLLWPPLLLYLLIAAFGAIGSLITPWKNMWDAFYALHPICAVYSINRGMSHLYMFYPHKLCFALGLLFALLALWYWKPNWLTGLLLVIPFYLLSSYTGIFLPSWAAVL